MLRTHTCGELRKEDEGKDVVLAGWAHSVRTLGNMAFIDLRDRYGMTQLVLGDKFKEIYSNLTRDSVIIASGGVKARKDANPKLETGDVEVEVDNIVLVSKAEALPLEIFNPDVDSTEETRLEYRYLDLRHPEVQRILEFRFKAETIIRNYFEMQDFVEIETPYLGKPTPEGARDFLVPSRKFSKKFWALQQSPQQYKQLLMVGGIDRYFQIVRCFRDEDLRKDRQYEFTQVDVEMSFVDEADILKLSEGLVALLYSQLLGIKLERPFPRMTWEEAIDKYGSDKPDTRFDLVLRDYSDMFLGSGFRVFEREVEKGGVVKAIRVPRILRRSEIEELETIVKREGFPGLAWVKVADILSGPVSSYVSDEFKEEHINEDSTFLFLAGQWQQVSEALGRVRLHVAEKEGLKKGTSVLWVTDFPLFEWSDEREEIQSMHHPFTAPKKNAEESLDEDLPDAELLRLPARAYDLVINGVEIGGGSIRITDPDLQRRMFEILGLSEEEANDKFGMLLEAFRYGVPPHGGIAFGLDRILQIMLDKGSIRDVIAFPKSKSGRALMEDAPSEADPEQLEELE